jgi:hypothetical protein
MAAHDCPEITSVFGAPNDDEVVRVHQWE